MQPECSYLLGVDGEIGRNLKSQNTEFLGVNRKNFDKFLEDVVQSSSKYVLIVNAATLSISDLYRVLLAIRASNSKFKFIHLSSTSVSKDSRYGIHKRNEETVLTKTKIYNLSVEIKRIGVPIFCRDDKFLSCGYWNNINFSKVRIILSFGRIPCSFFGKITVAGDVYVSENITSDKWFPKIINLPSTKLLDRMPIRKINVILGYIGITIWR